ncbi:flagellar type III secretion system pore protein FliP [Gilvimarinus sp. SDUM040013]|uniref:Flagellar biosynthetic protein FliP n=1 Tax=Gilvimarinus gilvus TaxID=3058038 RepID=A0ABU4RZK6_9GAMM|nr:flagellar type III secretion system pore protein FliP [Gilvimarinus sp. SDUM040013]MDO3385049.1 flagellar type III secretion system pore protein FliP [Gilvimarinus sp. SDUM040013]MDX6848424.1 flagellar type III secretion system pore protein FliP [Gilvimarinus sp. SDUM040013]
MISRRYLFSMVGLVLLVLAAMAAPAFAQPADDTLTPGENVAELVTSPGSLPAIPGLPAFTVQTNADGEQEYTVTLQILAIMTMLTFLPALLMMMTSFTRIIIVFAILRQALGLQQSPSNQILIGLSLFLTLFIMKPVFEEVNVNALQPYLNSEIAAQQALAEASRPFHQFMLAQTRESDIQLFVGIAGNVEIQTPEDTPFSILVPAFVTSELKTAFQIGFIIFIPFLVIDIVVASVLMAMGMMMLSPLIVSLPFKLMLFVLVDGWAMIIGTLAASFGV